MSDSTGQWRLETMQLVNWGGFEGHHTIDLSADSTLISGATGTGKSTLLDAYIALLMASRVPFNGASNDNVTGRARGGDQRNVLRYMRGKIDDDRPAGSVTLTDKVLRGRDAPTWSAIAATWHTAGGTQFTALRLYYATPSAARFDDITKRMATINGPFDLAAAADLAAAGFDPTQMRDRFAGLDFHGSYRSFCTTVCSRLGIGLPGEGERALGLLARIQAGRSVTTVDGLFKTMVLERPRTLAIADEAVAHFDDLHASYEAMKTAEQQVQALAPIVDWHTEWRQNQAEADTIATLGVDAGPGSPWQIWSTRTEQRVISTAIAATTAARVSADQRAAAARRDEYEADEQLAALRAANAGGLAAQLEDLDLSIEHLHATHQGTEQARKIYRDRTQVLGEPSEDAAQFAAAQQAAAEALAAFPATITALRDERDIAVGAHQQLQLQAGRLDDELDSLSRRAGAVPAELHNARCAVADALGCDPDQVPFVGELIDMRAGYEPWRLAADRALGGFATTLLIDQARLDQARIQINTLTLGRRLSFEGAQLDHPLPEPADPRRLPGRLIVNPASPFAGWLIDRLTSNFDYTCVEDPADLAAVDRGLTITGQTKNRRRGAHGGTRAPVIGFTSTERRTELRTEIDQVNAQITAAATDIDRLDADLHHHHEQRDAYRYVVDTDWSSIDTSATAVRIDAALGHRQRLAEGDATADGQRRGELRARREEAARDRHLAEAELERLTTDLAALQLRAEELHTAGMQGEGALTAELADHLEEHLTALCADTTLTADTVTTILGQLRSTLTGHAAAARTAAARTAKMLTATFEAFQRQWPQPDLSTDVTAYPGYHDILTDLHAEGLHQRRATFVRDVNDWTGIDLLRLHGAMDEAVHDIKARLDPINDILASLAFGAQADRLHITLRHTATTDITAFCKELKTLAGAGGPLTDTLNPGDDDDVEKRFLTLARFINRIRKSDSTSERDYYLDVRRHVYIEAERRDTAGTTLNVYASLAGKSGGESQELIAFIVGAALRYQLGDTHWPRYAPVFLDEGFIKSDASFAGRAVAAWKGLGFQLVIGAPDDKVNSIEPHVDRILCVTKNSDHRSRITALTAAASTARPGPQRTRRRGAPRDGS